MAMPEQLRSPALANVSRHNPLRDNWYFVIQAFKLPVSLEGNVMHN